MSRKRLRTSSESTCRDLSSVFKLETAPRPLIKGSKRTTIDDEKVYLRSDPPGKDNKDQIMTNRDLTNLICPIFRYSIKHYGMNYGGEHRFKTANIIGGGGLDTVAIGNGLHTDSNRFVFNVSNTAVSDTISWTAGTQAWYESLSLPGTWTASNWNGEIAQKFQPSMVGLINAAKYGLRHMGDAALFADPNSDSQRPLDFTVCYRGGSQTHTFINHNEHEIYYEIWELCPRDIIYDWIEGVSDTQDADVKGVFDNIHSYISYAYRQSHPNSAFIANSAESAVNNTGSYSQNLGGISTNGQKCLLKNDHGFRINTNCLDLYHKFRISKSQRGSLKSGSVLKYSLKHGPFKVRNSVWNRWVTGRRPGDLDPTDDAAADSLNTVRFGHLVPCATKILCVRFWSELGNLNTFNSDESTTFKFDLNNVANVQGRVMHTVDENHSIRVVPYTRQNQIIEKNFRSVAFGASGTGSSGWRVVNDESNTQMTTDETN